MPEHSTSDPLEELRDRIHATREAAERLAAEAADAASAERAGRPPPAGWATPGERQATREELHALVALVDALRALVPEELRQQLAEVARQILLLLRAIIDFWVERLENERGAEPDVEDIPIS